MKQTMEVTVFIASTIMAGMSLDPAHAQPVVPGLPSSMNAEVTGPVTQYLLNHHGDVDGLLLEDGTQVHFPPHMERDLLAVAKPHDIVQAQGYRGEGGPVVDASVITNTQTGQSVAQREPSWRDRPVLPPHVRDLALTERHAEGTIRTLLYGSRGEMNGAVLDDGTIVRIPPHAITQVDNLLQAGRSIQAVGYGTENEYGRVLEATTIGASGVAMMPIQDAGFVGDGHRGNL
jgi:hypothetical protein